MTVLKSPLASSAPETSAPQLKTFNLEKCAPPASWASSLGLSDHNGKVRRFHIGQRSDPFELPVAEDTSPTAYT